MASESTSLEGRFFYRLIKVIYSLALISCSLGVLFMGFAFRPIDYVDSENSSIVCSDNKEYALPDVGILLWSSKKELSTGGSDDRRARKVCRYGTTRSLDEYEISSTDFQTMTVAKVREKYPQYNDIGDEWVASKIEGEKAAQKKENYRLNLSYKTSGSWTEAFAWWVFGVGFLYLAFNLFREMLLYLAFGKPFQWGWLKRPRLFND